MGVTFNDHSAAVTGTLDANILRALTAMGEEAVGRVIDKMQHGYHDAHPTKAQVGGKWVATGDWHTDIWMSGDLQGDISKEVDVAGKKVTIGTGMEYAHYVHDGTYKLNGRPFLRDGIMENVDRLREIAAAYLKRGF